MIEYAQIEFGIEFVISFGEIIQLLSMSTSCINNVIIQLVDMLTVLHFLQTKTIDWIAAELIQLVVKLTVLFETKMQFSPLLSIFAE